MTAMLDCLSVKRGKDKVFMRGFNVAISLLDFIAATFAQDFVDNAIEVEAKGSYLKGDGNSKKLARQLAITITYMQHGQQGLKIA